MDITKSIAILLSTEKQVCIPGLGTLSTSVQHADEHPKKKPAEQSGQKKEGRDHFFPFLAGLAFSEKYDARDRKLAEKIAESRQINPNLAGYEVDKFVIRVKQELSRNGSFELPEVGKLTAGQSGKVIFESLLNDRAIFGLSPVELKPLEHGNMVEVITRKIGFKNVRKNKFKLVWAILIGLIILGLVSLLLVRLNIIGV
ncbi:hypothetical protein EDD80_11259 [Anseongella ginsenosidimutans]|uniref:CCDC81-like prokaryotic HU domain-containing protein n=1 Tax=Anseongella ginsenosidimutans TaxID=496056 RepID=A0A4R3KMS1_9SPHI|nr:hypothetical protein [Anseongella ginsenosidimutans]QEC52731.1 hypothetical protein FRZ59_10535 [Anseongella ginsenosidimutans]TCS85484.1 hypothetical protein EDD80_11259 [Anseongella ginsenosidimutans]